MALWTVIAAIIGGALYRLRGGWFSILTGLKQKTQLMRAIWSVPTGLLIYFLAGGPWYIAPALIVSVFASMALYGHGAHMVFDAKQFIAFSKNKTELLTEWWLPQAFGGIPDTTWPHWKVTAYNLAGMSFIGLIRNSTAIAPVAITHDIQSLIYALTGILHGPLYWAGYRVNGKGETAEVITGAVTWASIILIFG